MNIANKIGLGLRITAVSIVKGATFIGKGAVATGRDIKLGLQGREIVAQSSKRKVQATQVAGRRANAR